MYKRQDLHPSVQVARKTMEKPADMNTKGLSGDEINKYVEALSMEFKEGRAELAPEVVQMMHAEHCNRFNSSPRRVTKKMNIRNDAKMSVVIAAECCCMERDCTTCASKFLWRPRRWPEPGYIFFSAMAFSLVRSSHHGCHSTE